MQRSVFRLAVHSKFKFLQTDFGFTLSASSSLEYDDADTVSVVYERTNSKIIIYCSIRDGWGLNVLLANPDFGEFAYHTYLRLVASEFASGLGFSLAASDNELLELIDLYSISLREHGAALLSGNSSEWNRLKLAEEHGEGVPISFEVEARFCDATDNPIWE